MDRHTYLRFKMKSYLESRFEYREKNIICQGLHAFLVQSQPFQWDQRQLKKYVRHRKHGS